MEQCDPRVEFVALGGNITVTAAAWSSRPLVIGRNITITTDDPNQERVLNLGGLRDLFLLQSGGSLTFTQVKVVGVARNSDAPADMKTRFLVRGFGLYPSLAAQPNTTMSFFNTTVEFYSKVWSACPQYTARSLYAVRQYWPDAMQPAVDIIEVNDFKTFLLAPTTNNTDASAGSITVNVQGLRMACVRGPISTTA
ncbi:hypothetical protein WJX72_000272 [[Myrmecia] bisecta]|uniref:Uncharacterized protein n=1 Tax=[Myrmecia] bisecta TaxID=41462 RepID=A0AAW1QNY0_9CHLO